MQPAVPRFRAETLAGGLPLRLHPTIPAADGFQGEERLQSA
jgi:hypothetical protein